MFAIISTNNLLSLIEEITEFVDYAKKLEFAEDPDYAFLRKLLRDLFIKNGLKFDNKYDWMDPSNIIVEGSKPAKTENQINNVESSGGIKKSTFKKKK